jgi:hypothetical protein
MRGGAHVGRPFYAHFALVVVKLVVKLASERIVNAFYARIRGFPKSAVAG